MADSVQNPNDSSEPKNEQEIALINHIESLFTREKLKHNVYLINNMDHNLEISLNSVYKEKSINRLSDNEKVVLSALNKAKNIEVLEEKKAIRIKIPELKTKILIKTENQEKQTIVKDHIKKSYSEVDKIDDISFSGNQFVKIAFKDEPSAQRFYNWIKEIKINNETINPFFEPENVYLTLQNHIYSDKLRIPFIRSDDMTNYGPDPAMFNMPPQMMSVQYQEFMANWYNYVFQTYFGMSQAQQRKFYHDRHKGYDRGWYGGDPYYDRGGDRYRDNKNERGPHYHKYYDNQKGGGGYENQRGGYENQRGGYDNQRGGGGGGGGGGGYDKKHYKDSWKGDKKNYSERGGADYHHQGYSKYNKDSEYHYKGGGSKHNKKANKEKEYVSEYVKKEEPKITKPKEEDRGRMRVNSIEYPPLPKREGLSSIEGSPLQAVLTSASDQIKSDFTLQATAELLTTENKETSKKESETLESKAVVEINQPTLEETKESDEVIENKSKVYTKKEIGEIFKQCMLMNSIKLNPQLEQFLKDVPVIYEKGELKLELFETQNRRDTSVTTTPTLSAISKSPNMFAADKSFKSLK